jgi:hypothetical protein
MKLAIEPKNIELTVETHSYTEDESKLMSKIIEHYKKNRRVVDY